MDKEDWQAIYQELAELIGEENTLKIFKDFRGSTVNFPMRLVRREVILNHIQSDHSAGASVHELSAQYDLAERTVRKYLQK
ncbi:Mor transcription activator family protein [Levilactobacillus cerevisiae]|uniref:Mor transcription activator family protein n=1 Tax=Levilactobacillus cerevisiae TaxID=1704076 RepID=UPI000F7B9AB1|nr:Mor transcription activator family protein [Levilactobacillus cerevisiae]